MLVNPIINPKVAGFKSDFNCDSRSIVSASNGVQPSTCRDFAALPSTQVYLLNNFRNSNINFKGGDNLSVEEKAKLFMEQIASSFSAQKKCFVIVTHILPNSHPLFDTLSKYGRIAGVVAKPNSIDEKTYTAMKAKGIPFLDIRKEDFSSSDIISNKIVPLSRSDEKLIIIDTGGYFAGSLEELEKVEQLGGIVEDTENGLQKYEEAIKNRVNRKIPIFSVARSRAKDFEDYLIGRSVASSTLTLIEHNKMQHANKRIGVIGFGEVGRGAALYLRDIKHCDVQIFDHADKVQRLAKQSGFKTVTRDEIIRTSDILICATGNHSLKDSDIVNLKKGCLISSCTSGDDEFGFEALKVSEGKQVGHRLRSISGLFFLNDGNAINFINPQRQTDMLSPYINLTHGGLIACCAKLDNNDFSNTLGINVLDRKEEEALISKFYQILSPNNENSKFLRMLFKTPLRRRV